MGTVLRQLGFWKLPRITTGDGELAVLENASYNENGGYNLHTSKGVIRNVGETNLLNLSLNLRFLQDMTDKRLDLYTNVELKTGHTVGWNKLGFNDDAVRRLVEYKRRCDLLEHRNQDLWSEVLNPPYTEKFWDKELQRQDRIHRLSNPRLKSPSMYEPDYGEPGSEYEV